ncbi:hypothetical protein ACQUFY_05865 [Robbsia andropogonis]|uniref:hypothetical protein n=1 Tax=Robbsia andropogonis TaxID=28092 RepID=UPI003D22E74A
MLKDFAAYFDSCPTATVIEPATFQTYFALRHPKAKPETLAIYNARIKTLGADVEPGVADGIRERLVRGQFKNPAEHA